MNVSKKNGIKWWALDADEPNEQLTAPIPAPNAFIEIIRRIRKISRIKKYKSSPNMKGRIMGNYGNKYETFVADTGSPVSIIPVNVAKKNGIKW